MSHNIRGPMQCSQDFAEVLQRPKLVMLGAALQYTVMPGLGFLISRLANLPPPYAVGYGSVVCVACEPTVDRRSGILQARSRTSYMHSPCPICNQAGLSSQRLGDPAEPWVGTCASRSVVDHAQHGCSCTAGV